MTPDKTTLLSWQRGTLPDCYWYQLNGKSATENYADQKQFSDDAEDLIIVSEVKVK